MIEIAIEDAGSRLNDLIEAAAGGEDVVIARGDLPSAWLMPVDEGWPHPKLGGVRGKTPFMAEDFGAPIKLPPSEARPLFGSARGQILYIADDFDAPLEDFK